MPIFGVRNFTLNQYLGYVNNNMDNNLIFWVHKSGIVEFGMGLQGIRLNIWGLQTLGLIFRGQQRNGGRGQQRNGGMASPY